MDESRTLTAFVSSRRGWLAFCRHSSSPEDFSPAARGEELRTEVIYASGMQGLDFKSMKLVHMPFRAQPSQPAFSEKKATQSDQKYLAL